MNPLYSLLAGGLVAVGIWFSGVNHGKNLSNATCNVERLANEKATNGELYRLRKLAEGLAAQLNAADAARDVAVSQLARLNSLPHPHVLCHAAATGGSSPVPGIPPAASAGSAVLGELPVQPEFDPTPALYAEARRADAIVEECRYFYNRWPIGG